MKFTEMHVTEDAEIWNHPEQFLAFIKKLAVENPVLLVVDDAGCIREAGMFIDVKRKGAEDG
jgi:hypothetical protein